MRVSPSFQYSNCLCADERETERGRDSETETERKDGHGYEVKARVEDRPGIRVKRSGQ